MSDTRVEAEQELVSAGMAPDFEDSLGSALETSFTIPPRPKQNKQPESMMAAVAAADTANPNTVSPADESSETQAEIPGMAEWKDTYEGYLHHWHEESAEARKKAQETRERIERERAEEAKKVTDKEKAEKAALKAKDKAEKDALKLKEELEGRQATSAQKAAGHDAEREQKVKEAWEMIKSAGETDGREITTDARGVLPEDVAAGQALPAGEHRPRVSQTAYDPTTSTEPLPPSMSDSPSPATFAPTESATLSRHSATSQAWEEISGPSSSQSAESSGSNDDIVKVNHPRDRAPQPQQAPPPAPPSLTLSLFTLPGHLTLGRVTAVLGINLVLPFINGVMLGFGEIFAREAVRVTRLWYREGGSLFGLFTGRRPTGARGVSGVGLSGSGF